MNKNIIVTLVAGLIIGVGGTLGATALMQDDDDTQEAASSQQTVTDHSAMSMDEMNSELENLSGDDFDKAFIEMMIAHHEGAVDMAELSADRARHDEVKQLSQEIIEAQEAEIAEMRQWQADWGYDSDEVNQMMHGDH